MQQNLGKHALLRVSKSLLHLRKRSMKAQTYFWQLGSLAQHKIMVSFCTNIMVKQEYSSRIRSLRNPHWVIRSSSPLVSSQLSKADFKNTFMLPFSLFFINIMKHYSFFLKPPTPLQCPALPIPILFFKTRTPRFGFLVTRSQWLSSAHLLWLKPLMKNNWCNQWCLLPSIHMLDSRVTAPVPLLAGPILVVQVGSTVHTLPLPQVKGKHTFKSQCNIRWSGSKASPKDDLPMFPKSLARHYGRWNLK